MSKGQPQLIIVLVVGVAIGYGVATAQHFFTRQSISREMEDAQNDIKNLKSGREAIEKRANRLEAQVYAGRAKDSLSRGDSRGASQFLGNASTFFENGALKGNPDHAKVTEKLRAAQKSLSPSDLNSLLDEIARLTPPLSSVGGGAGQ